MRSGKGFMQNTATLWKKNTAVFLVSQAISLFGSSLVQYAITWHITLTTQSGAYMTIAILCGFLPSLFIAPFAGVWADRYDRKKLIMLSDGMIALSTLILAIVFLLGGGSLWLLFAASVLRSIGGAVQSPSVNALVPDLVPEAHLTRINGINGSVQSLLSLVSPALAGALYGAVGSLELIFFLDVITAAIAIFILLRFLKIPARHREASAHTGYFSEIREGVGYVRRNAYLAKLFLFSIVIYLCTAPVAFLTPLQTVRSYGEEVWRLTGIEIAFSAGMLLGGVMISTLGNLKNRVISMALSLCALGVFTILLGMGNPFWMYLLTMALAGLSLPYFNTSAIVLLQENVDPAYMGRVFSVLTMISSSVMPLGMLIFGPLSDRVSIEWLLIITGLALLLSSAFLLFDRSMRKAGLQRRSQSDMA